ncbi:MAG: SpoVK/Ycf46/Vps4 family AAA+-type ATPase [Crocinitomix sp.]|jgi:SpoVK/Ycf46/Vps4 family AAA+-type ATPase
MEAIQLQKVKHTPSSSKIKKQYDALLGLENQKQFLLSNLRMILDKKGFSKWLKEYHPNGLGFLGEHTKRSPLIILSGDVGCGKTELANLIGTPLAELLKENVQVFSTPSDLRGSGRVGEISARITQTFRTIQEELDAETGILIMDEADDVASSREEDQQHREDKAGVNALIKELDRLEKSNKKVAVLFITNRSAAMDPAILRRASIEIHFERPTKAILSEIVDHILNDLSIKAESKAEIVDALFRTDVPFTFSDVFRRILPQGLSLAWQGNKSFDKELLLKVINQTTPSPKFNQS